MRKTASAWDVLNAPIPGTRKLVSGTPLGESLASGAKGLFNKVKGLTAGPELPKPKTMDQIRASRAAAYKVASVKAFADEVEKIAFTQSQYGDTGGFVDFHQVSSQPGMRRPSLKSPVVGAQRFTDQDKTAGSITPGGLTPKARLSSSTRIGMPKITAGPGPSIAEQVKPKGPGSGFAIPGATKV